MIVNCQHKKRWVYVAGYALALISGYSLHARIATDSQYRIERRDSGRPYLIDRGTKDEWYIDRHLLDKLPSEHPEAKKKGSLEDKAK